MPLMTIVFEDGMDIERLSNTETVLLVVSKDIVNNMDFTYIEGAIRVLKAGKLASRQKAVLIFIGYDDVPEEIYEIIEIRNWMTEVIKRHPYFLYYLNPNIEQNLAIITACISDIVATSTLDKKSPNEYYSQGIDIRSVPKVKFQITLPRELALLIINETIKYCLEIREEHETMFETLIKIPSLVTYMEQLAEGGV